MKKGLINVIILALTVSNLILTAILVFAVVPNINSTNDLVSKVAKAIDLELDSSYAVDASELSIDQVDVFPLTDKMTITLQVGKDGKTHYAVINAAISMNMEDKDYKKYQKTLAEKESLIRGDIESIVSKYTLEQFNAQKEQIRAEILTNLQEMYDSKFIVEVVFSDVTVQ